MTVASSGGGGSESGSEYIRTIFTGRSKDNGWQFPSRGGPFELFLESLHFVNGKR